MSTQQYRWIKLGVVFLLALTVSQSLVIHNYIIPLVALVISWLVLLVARRKVRDVVADERDYVNAGKSALVAMQVYSWIAVVVLIVLYALRDSNPLFEPIGMTLAFSVCGLMVIYALLFRLWFTKR